jgi:ribonuclease HI
MQTAAGEGSKATLANAPNADILAEIIERLRERIEKGSATFLVKVKSHRGDPLNKRADDDTVFIHSTLELK